MIFGVTNLWPTRLIGDQRLTPIKRFTRTNIAKFPADSPLMPSGPAGPVTPRREYVVRLAPSQRLGQRPVSWRGWGTRVVRVPYTEGTLAIDLRDPSTKSLVWRAIAREDKGDAAKLEDKLDDMVKKAFDKYPPKAK